MALKYPLESYGGNRFMIFRAKEFIVEGKEGKAEVKLTGTKEEIILYMPNNLTENISQNWSAGEVLSKQFVLKKLGTSLLNITGDAVKNLMASKTGKAFNPSEVLLYNSPGFRTFPFSWEFVPKSEKEVDIVRKILMSFKTWMLPNGSKTDNLLDFPCVWEIEFIDFGDLDYGLKDRTFALTNLDSNYTPDGAYITFKNGFPVKINLSVTFQETVPLFRKDLESKI